MLAQAFNAMAEQLAHRVDMLETQVERRTTKLTETNARLQREISECTRSEAAWCASEERFRLIFENAPIGMGFLTLDARLLQVNQAFCDTVGYTPEELVGRSIMEITHPDDIAPNVALDQQVLNGEISHFQMEKRYFHKGGCIMHVLLQVSLLRDAEGGPSYFIGQVVDITQPKQATAALRRPMTS